MERGRDDDVLVSNDAFGGLEQTSSALECTIDSLMTPKTTAIRSSEEQSTNESCFRHIIIVAGRRGESPEAFFPPRIFPKGSNCGGTSGESPKAFLSKLKNLSKGTFKPDKLTNRVTCDKSTSHNKTFQIVEHNKREFPDVAHKSNVGRSMR